jgi:hypothetical protein
MPKTFFQDEKVIFEVTFYSDRKRTIPVDPSTIEFHIKSPDGISNAGTPTSNGGTGMWKAEYVLDKYGTWEWRWHTDTPRIVSQGEIWVIERNTED